jgi:hypothetical protein
MLKSIIYKEWIKLKWFILIYLLFALLAVGYVFIRARHDIAFHEAKNYWYAILFQGFQYFRYLKFVPLAGGLAFAIAQYFPETVNKRIKLSFHLPREENGMLLLMMGFGAGCLLLCYTTAFLVFLVLSSLFFPSEIIMAAVVSVIPWFLGGFALYFLVATIVLEPVWLFRFLYLIAASVVIPFFFKPAVTGGYAPVNLIMAGMVCLLSISLLFSGHRFRKGEM